MKSITLSFIASSILLFMAGCLFNDYVQPLRLYNVEDGTIIEVFLLPAPRTNNVPSNHGKIITEGAEKEQFSGEYVLGMNYQSNYQPLSGSASTTLKTETELKHFAERYGYGRESDAQPKGTGIIVSNTGTVIEIIMYSLSRDLQTGDGVAKDNHGNFYRVFLNESMQRTKEKPVKPN